MPLTSRAAKMADGRRRTAAAAGDGEYHGDFARISRESRTHLCSMSLRMLFVVWCVSLVAGAGRVWPRWPVLGPKVSCCAGSGGRQRRPGGTGASGDRVPPPRGMVHTQLWLTGDRSGSPVRPRRGDVRGR